MIDALWTFLIAPENREVLSWIGGGLAVVAAGLWTALKSLGGKRDRQAGVAPPAPATAPDLLTDRGGQAAGRNIYRNSGNSTSVVHGLSGWQLAAIVAILAGAGLLAVSQVGSRVTANDRGIAVGGNVEGSTISVGD